MSIIVAVTKGGQTVMAADSLTSFGDGLRVPPNNCSVAKIRRVNGSLLGAAGWGIYDCIVDHFLAGNQPAELGDQREIFSFFLALWKALHDRYPFVNDQAHSRDTPFGDLDATFLVANRGGIFKVSHDMDVCRFNRYFAIGSGADYALGAMFNLYEGGDDAAAIARRAVLTAIEFDMHCGGDVLVEDVASLTPSRRPPRRRRATGRKS
jgi:ATP-dependent protease HslVU (ClpYQ) peptidase subunit